ncbi:MAG: hypothetical protein A3F40_02445 [Chlamydiae bacterium RIFCSPHIGHO2_12_FULL_27_8]|nr:MAG: hypothetical protein A3F40_02445 [Chlamydiae bacterium RIFCSPHIGHO2_12_FULL_27_8]
MLKFFEKFGFKPVFFDLIKKKQYRLRFLKDDLNAGFILSILSLPMAISYAISSGVRPEQGIITSIIAGIVIAVFGGSRYLIAGPTGGLVVIVSGILSSYGYSGLVLAIFMSSMFLLLIGLLKLGKSIKLLPYPVIVGFTSGLALIIAVNQIPMFLQISLDKSTNNIFYKLFLIFQSINQINFTALIMGVSTIFIVIYFRKVTSKFPGSLIAIILTSLVTYYFHLNVETIGKNLKEFTVSFHSLTFPSLNFDMFIDIFTSSFSIALLIAIESLLCASVADGMTGTRHRPDTELIAQSIANMVSILFSGLPITGGMARTVFSIKNGAKSPFASIFQSLFLLIFISFCFKLIIYIPLPCLAGILFVIAYNMSEIKMFSNLFNSPKSDIAVLLTTFFMTIVFGINIAIQSGIVLSVFLFVSKISQSSYGYFLKEKKEEDCLDDPYNSQLKDIPLEIEIFEIQGPFFFAAAEKFKTALFRINWTPKILILRLRHVPFIDATALRALEDIYFYVQKQKIRLILSGVNKNILSFLNKNEFLNKIGKENVFANIDQALNFSKNILEKEKSIQDPLQAL